MLSDVVQHEVTTFVRLL